MATFIAKPTCQILRNLKKVRTFPLSLISVRYSNTLPHAVVENHRRSRLAHDREKEEPPKTTNAPHDYKYIYPEFLPNPTWYLRDRITEKLERRDMLRRRAKIDMPEFYVGSIVAVTVADPYAQGKQNRFVGICINREGHGLRANFTLRNIVDNQGVEIMYEMYNPLLQKMEVLKLEKRLDDTLFYLRDAPAEYSTVPFNFESVSHPPGTAVPVNTIKVKLGPRPWHDRWERHELKGVQDLGLKQRFYDRAAEVATPWHKHDMMKDYRESINVVETEEIMGDIYGEMNDISNAHKRKRVPMVSKKMS